MSVQVSLRNPLVNKDAAVDIIFCVTCIVLYAWYHFCTPHKSQHYI